MIPLRDAAKGRSVPIVTYALIALSAAAFAYQCTLGSDVAVQLLFRFGFIPLEITELQELSVLTKPLTSAFLHGSWQHLAFNAWFLFLFGGAVERALGHVRFLWFYFAAAALGAAAQVLIHANGEIPLIGASGAVTGVIGAHLKLFPHGRMTSLVPWRRPLRDLSAALFAASWFVLQLLGGFSALTGPAPGGVVFFALIGGMLAGLWLVDAKSRTTADDTRGFGRSEYY